MIIRQFIVVLSSWFLHGYGSLHAFHGPNDLLTKQLYPLHHAENNGGIPFAGSDTRPIGVIDMVSVKEIATPLLLLDFSTLFPWSFAISGEYINCERPQ